VATAGAGLTFLSRVLGWFGMAVSGFDSSANALSGALQVSAARELGEREGDLLPKALPWSAGLLSIMCLIVAGQSSRVLERMVPRPVAFHRRHGKGPQVTHARPLNCFTVDCRSGPVVWGHRSGLLKGWP